MKKLRLLLSLMVLLPLTMMAQKDLPDNFYLEKLDNGLEVLTIEDNQFEAGLEFGNNIRTEFIVGMAKLEDRVVIVLDMEMILSNDELKIPGIAS